MNGSTGSAGASGMAGWGERCVEAILWGTIALFVLLLAVPFVDRGHERRWRRQPVALGIVGAVLPAIIVLTYVTTTTSAVEHL